MSNVTDPSLNLFKANLELQVKLAKLIQESNRQWLNFEGHLVDDSIAGSDALSEQLLQTEDWQKLASLPAETLVRVWQQRFGNTQALTQETFNAQTALARGIQDALHAWQQQIVMALGNSPSVVVPQGNPAWADLFKPWQQLWQQPATT